MQRLPLRVALGGLALTGSVLIMVAVGSQVPDGPVYAVAEVRAGLARQPGAWVGRTVLVRGIAVQCPDPSREPSCFYEQPQLLGGWGAPAAKSLLLDWDAAPPPLVGTLRQLPLLGRLLPAPQLLHWGAVATYLVRLQAIPESLCGTGECIEAILVGAAP